MNDKSYSELETRITMLETKKKDTWDKLQITSFILVPFAIAFVGHVFSKSMKEAEIGSQEIIAQSQLEIAVSNVKIAQAGTVASFFDALLSVDPERRKLAINAVLIALPVDGPSLVQVLEEQDNDMGVRDAASEALLTRRNNLLRLMFSENGTDRLNAYNTLLASWEKDDSMIPVLIDYALQDLEKKSAVYNSLLLLMNMDTAATVKHRNLIIDFCNQVVNNGPKTKERAAVLKVKMEGL